MAAKLIGSSFFLLVLVAGCRATFLNYYDLESSNEIVPPSKIDSNEISDVSKPAAAASQANDFRSDYEYNEKAGGWFKFHNIPATWKEARFRCHAEGGVVASPLNNELKAAILSFAKKQKNVSTQWYKIFSGVHATFSKGDYSSIKGVPLRHLAVTWATGQPNNDKNAESCLVMYTQWNGDMGHVECEEVLPYICYKKYTNLTINECGTSDPEYSLSRNTGSCYKFHGRSLIWSEAYTTCQAEGGYLAVINSETEATVVKDIYQKQHSTICCTKYRRLLAIGFRDTGVHHNFMTIHGETLAEAGFNRWYLNNPDNSTNPRTGDYGEHCGSLAVVGGGLLNDIYCNVPIAFICEKHPKSLRPDATLENFIESRPVKHEPLDDTRQELSSEETPTTTQ